MDWAEVFYPVTSGQHTFKWIYEKDASVSTGSDCGWIDFINYPPIAPLPDNQDIEVDLTPIDVTIPVNSIYNSDISISNLGDLNLNYTFTKLYSTNKAINACAAEGGCDEYISRVIFNTIDNSSTCSNYADYTGISTDVLIGSTYDLTIENGVTYSTDDVGVWFDWNIDGDFDDAGENVVCEYSNYGEGTFAILIPNDATPGLTNMRIRIKYSGDDCGSPCGTVQYGEVEDYSINVIGGDDWLSLTPVSGSIAGSTNTTIGLSFNSTDLAIGDYTVDLVINSDDPDEPQLTIPVSMHITNSVTFNFTALMQGPFDAGLLSTVLNSKGYLPLNQPYSGTPWDYPGTEQVVGIPNASITDWVLVEIRDASSAATATPATEIGRQAAFLRNDGSIVGLDGSSNLQFDNLSFQKVYALIHHRNHIEIISSEALSATANVFTYDFTAPDKSYGINSQFELSSGIWGMISGDANADGIVNDLDKTNWWNTEAGRSGYFNSDLNLEGNSDNRDKIDFWLPNLNSGSQVPQN